MLARTRLFAAVALMTGALTTNAITAHAQEYPSMNLRLAHFVTEGWPQSKVDQWWADEINSRSGGKINIRIFWAEAIAKSTEIADTVGSGAVQLGATAPAFTPSKLPLIGATNALPMSMPDTERAVSITRGLIDNVSYVRDELEANNLWPLYTHGLPDYHLICNQPVRKIEDFRGLKVRAFGAFQPRMWEELGATGVVVLPSEIYEGLQRGRIDCAFYSYDAMETAKLHEAGNYVITANFGPLATWPIFVNHELFQGWPDNVKTLFREVSEEASARSIEAVKEAAEASFEFFKESDAVEVIEFEDQAKMEAMMPDFIAIWQDSMEERGLGDAAAAVADYWREALAE